MKKNGFVLLEFIVSFTLITVLILPIFNCFNLFFKILIPTNKNSILDDNIIKKIESKGYSKILSENLNEVTFSTLPNIGMPQDSNKNITVLILSVKKDSKILNIVIPENNSFNTYN
ncbi:MAG: hypothetical protein ACRC0S_05430 [Fusobacteriaceae bacterium]